MRLTERCPTCNNILKVTEEVTFDGIKIRAYSCGHFTPIELTDINASTLQITGAGGTKTLRPYQVEGVKFIIDSEFACIIGDQMRLGKTPQALMALANSYETRTPCLILVRSANIWQWVREYKEWTDILPVGIFPIQGTKNIIPNGFSTYICSMDTFSRAGMVEKLLTFGFKLVIVDEAHSFKNTNSNRSKALVNFLYEISKASYTKDVEFNCWHCSEKWTENVTFDVSINYGYQQIDSMKYSKCAKCKSNVGIRVQRKEVKAARKCGIVMLTGTPIKNRADEYFIPLNLVDPANFPSLENFRYKWLEQDPKQKWSRIYRHKIEAFRKQIKPYYLRREKEDVFTDLPAINRTFTVISIDDENLKKAYNSVLDKLEEKQGAIGNLTFANSIGEMTQLRRICGLAKVKWASDYLDISLEDTENTRYAVGIHHKDVRETLAYQLGNFRCLTLSGEDNADQKDYIMRHFENSPERVLILNMLAGGVGMDFHYCTNVLILERMWSSADEEQFEFRFYNPDRAIMGDRSLFIEYIIAKGTIDGVFYDMIEEKRQIFGETVANNWSLESDPQTYKELVQRTLCSRL